MCVWGSLYLYTSLCVGMYLPVHWPLGWSLYLYTSLCVGMYLPVHWPLWCLYLYTSLCVGMYLPVHWPLGWSLYLYTYLYVGGVSRAVWGVGRRWRRLSLPRASGQRWHGHSTEWAVARRLGWWRWVAGPDPTPPTTHDRCRGREDGREGRTDWWKEET